jgi:hypothetical protein
MSSPTKAKDPNRLSSFQKFGSGNITLVLVASATFMTWTIRNLKGSRSSHLMAFMHPMLLGLLITGTLQFLATSL